MRSSKTTRTLCRKPIVFCLHTNQDRGPPPRRRLPGLHQHARPRRRRRTLLRPPTSLRTRSRGVAPRFDPMTGSKVCTLVRSTRNRFVEVGKKRTKIMVAVALEGRWPAVFAGQLGYSGQETKILLYNAVCQFKRAAEICAAHGRRRAGGAGDAGIGAWTAAPAAVMGGAPKAPSTARTIWAYRSAARKGTPCHC